MHRELVQGLGDLFNTSFNTVSHAVMDVPAQKDLFLLGWIRNQLLAWAFFGLWSVSMPAFMLAHFFFNDGQLFITFWNTMFTIQPFV